MRCIAVGSLKTGGDPLAEIAVRYETDGGCQLADASPLSSVRMLCTQWQRCRPGRVRIGTLADFGEILFVSKRLSRSIPEALRNSPEALKKLSDFRVAVEIPISYLTQAIDCLLYTSPSPRDKRQSRMPSSA